jgi:hypothetical protein
LRNDFTEGSELWKVRFPESTYAKIQQDIAQASPLETGGFIIAYPVCSTKPNRPYFVAKDTTDSQEWNEQAEGFLEPSTSFINDAAVKAEQKNSSLIFFHSHPSTFHPATFSTIDKEGNKKLLPNLSEILSGQPVGSIVLSQKGFDGTVLDKGKWQLITEFSIVGRKLTKARSGHNGNRGLQRQDTKWFKRQIDVIGDSSQTVLGDLHVAIVGAGGVGSAAAVQLAKLGVGQLLIIDPDTIEDTNIHRLYACSKEDIGHPKASVLARHIAKNGFSREVKAIDDSAMSSGGLDSMLGMDVILCCTDNQRSRSFLNDLAYQYAIPVVDIGCRVFKNGSENQAAVRVQVVGPDRACLWCTDVLDGRVIVQETYSPEQLENLRAEGYADTPTQPGLITLTTTAASIGVLRLLNLTTSFGPDCPTRTMFELLKGLHTDSEPGAHARFQKENSLLTVNKQVAKLKFKPAGCKVEHELAQAD